MKADMYIANAATLKVRHVITEYQAVVLSADRYAVSGSICLQGLTEAQTKALIAAFGQWDTETQPIEKAA